MIKNIQKGFTLIELLVVIAIIGILAGILFIAINPKEQSDKAKAARLTHDLKNIQKAFSLTSLELNKDISSLAGSNNYLIEMIDNGSLLFLPKDIVKPEYLNTTSSGFLFRRTYIRLMNIDNEDLDILKEVDRLFDGVDDGTSGSIRYAPWFTSGNYQLDLYLE